MQTKETTNSATKIVCTLGPATNSMEKIEALMNAGMTAARINMSHGSYSEHRKTIDIIKAVRNRHGKHIAIALDTRGPEYRVKIPRPMQVNAGDLLRLAPAGYKKASQEDRKSKIPLISSNMERLSRFVAGDVFRLDDGKLILEVVGETCEGALLLKAVTSHLLLTEKRISFTRKLEEEEFLQDKDIEDIKFGLKNDIDAVFLSFVEIAEHVLSVRKLMEGKNVQLIAKIETEKAMENIQDILAVADGILIARGDLGTEVGLENLFSRQKILAALSKNFIVIMGTEIMLSMVDNPFPTRAEVSDIGNAVCDGCQALMLSTETAVGPYAIECVGLMRKICIDAEKYAAKYIAMEMPMHSALLNGMEIRRWGQEWMLYCKTLEEARGYIFAKGVHIFIKRD